eukprot:1144217-Pelagomonas_calceolata.AAC.1
MLESVKCMLSCCNPPMSKAGAPCSQLSPKPAIKKVLSMNFCLEIQLAMGQSISKGIGHGPANGACMHSASPVLAHSAQLAVLSCGRGYYPLQL